MLSVFFRSICIRRYPNKAILDVQKSILVSNNSNPIKSLTKGANSKGGRNFTGRQTVFSRGGGHKRLYRSVYFGTLLNETFINSSQDISLRVIRVEYDPNRTSWINLMEMELDNGIRKIFYTLATHDVNAGNILKWGPSATITNGNRLPLYRIPTGTLIHNVELRPNTKSQLCKSAGTRCKVMRNDYTGSSILVALPSGRRIELSPNCYATVGIVSNILHNQKTRRKAGVSRWLGFRPVVRGISKNPVDHPHGGRTNGGCHPKTPWGKLTRGVKTRSVRKPKLLVKKKKP